MSKQTIDNRLEKLERLQSSQQRPPWLIVNDGDPIPDGVKCYHPDVNPDLWDKVQQDTVQQDKVPESEK